MLSWEEGGISNYEKCCLLVQETNSNKETLSSKLLITINHL